MQYISAQQAAQKWGISKRRVQVLCSENRIKDATRIGNMWAVPEDAQKPADGRVHFHPIQVRSITREARTALKKLTTDLYQKINEQLDNPGRSKMVFISLMATSILCDLQEVQSFNQERTAYCAISEELMEREENLGQMLDTYERFCFLLPSIEQYISRYSEYVDDILSWAYQYVNKLSLDSGLENTQFFTESYMIDYLTKDISKNSIHSGNFLDPACGGGNFLSHILERLYSQKTDADDAEMCLQYALASIYGYELDSNLAGVASINLKLKALMLLSKVRPICSKDWTLFCPNIFTSMTINDIGFLAEDFKSHTIRRIADRKLETLSGLVRNVTSIYTNPPFQTIKGMNARLKEHLKKCFPTSKCDLCNAFLIQCLHKIQPGGTIGMVTQSSWMYLDSFRVLRKEMMEFCTIQSIADLGSGAFYDLSGEKANVTLVKLSKGRDCTQAVRVLALRDLPLKEKAVMLSRPENGELEVEQSKLFAGEYFSFFLNQENNNELPDIAGKYGDYGIPMQGTSTGNAAELITYYWEHLNDPEWLPVSKGGGYSRWRGLNHYVLKWGAEGEYIRATKGSALRNTRYFDRTAIVYSDTGTSGFNARLLEKGQIFVASGPGIRDVKGCSYSHLALLNSRIFSYYLRRLSPKLTIAAGYIARVPVPECLLDIPVMEKLGRECYARKSEFLRVRPNNLEWKAPVIESDSIETYATKLFQKEMENELVKLTCEKQLDDIILRAYGVSQAEKEKLDKAVGISVTDIENYTLDDDLDFEMAQVLDANCQIIRTRVNKQTLGCDGLLEWVARKKNTNPKAIVSLISADSTVFSQCQKKYEDLVLHNIVLSILGFRSERIELEMGEVKKRFFAMFPSLALEWSVVEKWISTQFYSIHTQAFYSRPYYRYENGILGINFEG